MNDPTRASVTPEPHPTAPGRKDSAAPVVPASPTGFGPRVVKYLVQESIALPLAALVLFTAAIVSPAGEFPLNDDWVYTKSVRTLLETGRISGHPFTAATTVSQIAWGALFCKLFGFGHTTLRVSTLVLSFFGVWATSRSALALGLTRWPAVLCGALVFTSPLTLNLSYTFMSDVPFLAFSALAGLFYLSALDRPAVAPVFWGSVFGALAFLTRQFGIMIPTAFTVAAALGAARRQYRITAPVVIAFCAVWMVGGAIFVYYSLVKESGLVLPAPSTTAWPVRTLETLRYAAIAVCYMGLFLFPLAPAAAESLLRGEGQWNKTRWAALAAAAVMIVTFAWIHGPRRLPELGIGNMLYDLGVGPMTLSDAYLGYQSWIPLRIGVGWWPIMVFAVFTGGLLMLSAFDTLRGATAREMADENHSRLVHQDLFLLTWGAAMLACPWNPWLPKAFDRYFVAAIAPLVLLLARTALRYVSSRAAITAVLSVAVTYLFSVASLHDYLAWNRARWEAISALQLEMQVPADKIDGGFEYNGMYTSDEFMRAYHTRNFFESTGEAGGYWVMDNEYVIGISGPGGVSEPRPGYNVVFRKPYFAWIGWKPCEVAAFRRSAPAKSG